MSCRCSLSFPMSPSLVIDREMAVSQGQVSPPVQCQGFYSHRNRFPLETSLNCTYHPFRDVHSPELRSNGSVHRGWSTHPKRAVVTHRSRSRGGYDHALAYYNPRE